MPNTSLFFGLNVSKENKQIKHNITMNQINAIKLLAKDKSIVIKEADKGTVIMNVDFYKKTVTDILTAGSYYQSVPYNNRMKCLLNMIS